MISLCRAKGRATRRLPCQPFREGTPVSRSMRVARPTGESGGEDRLTRSFSSEGRCREMNIRITGRALAGEGVGRGPGDRMCLPELRMGGAGSLRLGTPAPRKECDAFWVLRRRRQAVLT